MSWENNQLLVSLIEIGLPIWPGNGLDPPSPVNFSNIMGNLEVNDGFPSPIFLCSEFRKFWKSQSLGKLSGDSWDIAQYREPALLQERHIEGRGLPSFSLPADSQLGGCSRPCLLNARYLDAGDRVWVTVLNQKQGSPVAEQACQ